MPKKLEGQDLQDLVDGAMRVIEFGHAEMLAWSEEQIAIDMLDCSTDFEGLYTVEELVPYIKNWLGRRFAGLS